MSKCPMCGVIFAPAPYHIYKIRNSGTSYSRVCSWKCQRAWEKEREEQKKRKKEEQAKKAAQKVEADVVEVVRCRDCEYWHKDTLTCQNDGFGSEHPNWYADDYCSYGERRADDGQ